MAFRSAVHHRSAFRRAFTTSTRLCSASSTATDAAEPVKRKPGRPRKIVVPSDVPAKPKAVRKPKSDTVTRTPKAKGRPPVRLFAEPGEEYEEGSLLKPKQPASDVLPPPEEWRAYFPTSSSISLRDRVSIKNPESAARVAHSFINTTSHGKTVIEAYPGPGALTRALMALPKGRIKKLIVLEDQEVYLDYLKPLEKIDPRVHVISMAGHAWDTYQALEDTGLLDGVQTMDWEEQHSQLHFISHLRQSVLGEQLIAQLFRCIPDRAWIFKFGRIPMSFILDEWVWQRISAPAHDPQRCKLGVVAEAVARFKLSLPMEVLDPYDDHFHPLTRHDPRSEAKRRGSPFVAVNITPKVNPAINAGMLDQWDYVLRRLFVLKSTPLKSAIGSLAPGAQTLLKTLTSKDLPPEERVDVSQQVRALSIQDWQRLLNAFDEWPFAPEDLMIGDNFSNDKRVLG
ncbi:hypothetical protein PLICRDRAFT_695743 [Plicaturopsis crispa FD-325 SS-3]|nr:hypothetical protein PLICRDRAFT_695743 [Plicaturopsis crispa FD-325 SS-3]